MPKLQDLRTIQQRQRCPFFRIEFIPPIGSPDAAMQFLLRIVSQKKLQNLKSTLLVAHILQGLDKGHIHLGQGFRHKQAPICRHPPNDGLGCLHLALSASGTLIFQNNLPFFSI